MGCLSNERSLGITNPNPNPNLQLLSQKGGRKQVNKALHTCTSWYAYAEIFGSSISLHYGHLICEFILAIWPLFCRQVAPI